MNYEPSINKINQTGHLYTNIKSAYILRKILDNIPKYQWLEIIKCNKKIKNRLNLSINDYIKFCQLNSSIIIEIKPALNKYGKFINISKEDKEYFHIYFNDEKKEINTNELTKENKVNKIKIIINHQIISFKRLFHGCHCIESIYFKQFYRTNIIDMSFMFYYCKSLKELDFSNFNTNNVNDMSCMFQGCSSLKELNISNFNTNNVTNMRDMFSLCSSLKELNLSNFNTNNVWNMS